MNKPVHIDIRASACPHDCPSTCALEIEVIDGRTIGRVRGAADNGYTAGVVCAKVARYAERVHHPDRLTQPLRRVGEKGARTFEPIGWEDALDIVAENFLRVEQRLGSEAVWPYYYAGTMAQADLPVLIRPGTDGALACAVMHCLFRDGKADRAFLQEFTDAPDELEAHLKTRGPEWASRITGCDVATIEEFAALIGANPRTYLRLGYGFSRSRNGAVNMHAASCIAAVRGSWRYEGGGAFHNNGAIYHWNKTMIEGSDVVDRSIRALDQSRMGPILVGERDVLMDGPPVSALLIQNTNPVSVCPDQEKVKRGFARDDLFVCVHEHFMTETAVMADIVLPATMFMEHDDVYQGGGHQYIILGPKLIEPPGACGSNHDVICGLARRLGAQHPGFDMSARELIDWTLRNSGWGTIDDLEAERWIDCQPDFETAHYTKGFAWPDGKFRFKPEWPKVPFRSPYLCGPVAQMPTLPDHWSVIEEATDEHPFRLATSPSRNFLNSTFNETPTSLAREKRPEVMIHPDDAAAYGVNSGDKVLLGNHRGEVRIHARVFDGVRRGVLIAESIWPNDAYEDGRGINTLTGADAIAPYGGAAFHDNRVWIKPLPAA